MLNLIEGVIRVLNDTTRIRVTLQGKDLFVVKENLLEREKQYIQLIYKNEIQYTRGPNKNSDDLFLIY